MDTKLLLVKAITLLYRESQLGKRDSNELIKGILTAIKLPESVVETDRGRDVIVSLRNTAYWMCEQPESISYDRSTFLQRIRVACSDDLILYEAVAMGTEDAEEEKLRNEAEEHRRDLQGHIRQQSVTEILKKASSTAMFNEGSINWSSYVADVMEMLEPFKHDASAVLTVDEDDIMFGDVEKMTALVEEAFRANMTEGVMIPGYQGLQRMLGEHRGFRRGDMTVLGALQHNFKSGMLRSVFVTTALFNKPFMKDPNKKPMLMYVSLEDKISDALMWMFKYIKENREGVAINPADFTAEYIVEYTSAALREQGYEINMKYCNPSSFTYRDLEERVEKFEAMGYEIHMLAVDYLALMSKEGLPTGGATGQDIRELFRRTRNLAASKSIHVFTPHQLSTEAKMLTRENPNQATFVSDIANKGYYDGCKTLDQEVDLELYIHIVESDGKYYLTMARGKHRGLMNQTDPKDKYCALPFSSIGFIPWDHGLKDRTRRKVGGGAVGSGEEYPWHEYADAA